MAALMDARCPKCRARIAWEGKAIDRPPCPHCGHQVPHAELVAADRQIAEIEEEMLAEFNGLRDEPPDL